MTDRRELPDILAATMPKGMHALIARRKKSKPQIAIAGFITRRVVLACGRVQDDWTTVPNGAVYEGLNKMADVNFRNQSVITQWYAGLIRQTGFTGESINDTMANHPGWVEEQQYTAATRPAWSPAAASLGQLTIASPISLVANATIDVKGVFVTSNNTKGGTTGTLWATAVEGTARNVLNTATYEFFYSTVFSPAN